MLMLISLMLIMPRCRDDADKMMLSAAALMPTLMLLMLFSRRAAAYVTITQR